VPITVGIIVADDSAGLGFLVDSRLGLGSDAVHDAVRQAFVEAGGHLPHREER
jgi:hypothetical protein